MEYDYANPVDLEWQNEVQSHFKRFSCQNQNNTALYSYDEVLKMVFSSENEMEEVNYRDKETCETCLIDLMNFLAHQPTPPKQAQIRFLLNIAKHVSRDETCFINLNANKIWQQLIYVTQHSNVDIERETGLHFIDMLSSFLEHFSGVKGLIDNKWWIDVYKLIIKHQRGDENISVTGYTFISNVLERALKINKELCEEMIQILAGPLLNAACLINAPQPSCIDFHQLIEELTPSILCLIEILERLLDQYNAEVLHCVMCFKVDLASDTVSKIANNKTVRIILHRIMLILSFFELTDVFDGIKSISQDPLALTGFLRIIELEIDKGAMDVMFELYYHALKYLKAISQRIPKCVLKEKTVDIETELLCLQLEPIMLMSQKMDYKKFLKEFETDIVRMSHLTKVLKNLSLNTLKLGLKIKQILPTLPYEIFIDAVRNIIRSRNLYSKENLAISFEGLIYSLQDTLDHIKLERNREEASKSALQAYIFELLKAILLFITTFNLSWSDCIKVLELAEILNNGCYVYEWPAPIIVEVLKLLKEIIVRRLSPAMSLLIDRYDDLKNFGPFLYQKCFTTDWEVRNEVLEVVHTIAITANKSFSSFKDLLIDACLPNLISTMALNDANSQVRATAFKCLHEIIVMEGMDEVIKKDLFINKVLDVLLSNADSIVKQQAIKLICIIYYRQEELEEKVLTKVYKYMEHVALIDDPRVQMEAIEFWCQVTKKHLAEQGWLDKKFPSVTFSKKIVCMTNKEIRKRIYKVLNELGRIGCLNIYVKVSDFKNLPPEANTFIASRIYCFNELFREYEVTPESMLFNQEFLELPQITNSFFLSPPNSVDSSNSDQMIQEIINDTYKKMISDDVEFIHDEDLYSLMDIKYSRSTQENQANFDSSTKYPISAAEFVDFVYKKVELLSTKSKRPEEDLEGCGQKSNHE